MRRDSAGMSRGHVTKAKFGDVVVVYADRSYIDKLVRDFVICKDTQVIRQLSRMHVKMWPI